MRWTVCLLALLLSGCAQPAATPTAPAAPAEVPEPVPEPYSLVLRGFIEDDEMVVRLSALWDDGRARPFEGWVEVFVRPVDEGRSWIPRYWLEYATPENFTDARPAYFEMRGDATWLRPGELYELEAAARTWDGFRINGTWLNRA